MEQVTRGQQRTEHMRQWRERNKEPRQALDKAWYESNKETIQEKRGVKYNCEYAVVDTR